MYNIKKQIFEELSSIDSLPRELSTITGLRSAQMTFNEIAKNGSCVTILSDVKSYYEKKGADIKTTENGWKISFETAEKKQKYYNLLENVYKDGDVESFERQNLKQLQQELGLSDSVVNSIEKLFIKEKKELNQEKKQLQNKKRKKSPSHCIDCHYERGR